MSAHAPHQDDTPQYGPDTTIDAATALRRACAALGRQTTGATVIRDAENTLFRLPGGLVARVSRPGQQATAAKELRVSRWLSTCGVPVVEALPEPTDPVIVAGRAVTFWRELPPHAPGGTSDLAELLRRLHALPVPEAAALPPVAPFVRIAERITAASLLQPADRRWLLDHLADLQHRYSQLPAGLPHSAVHGDAWAGNVAATSTGPVLLDLERFAVGPPEWDLTSVAIAHFTFGYITDTEWADFCQRYGHDVTTWPGYPVLRDIQELRKATFAFQTADQHPHTRDEAIHRLACLRGHRGPRPWDWKPIP